MEGNMIDGKGEVLRQGCSTKVNFLLGKGTAEGQNSCQQ